jgi:hypothetical protein
MNSVVFMFADNLSKICGSGGSCGLPNTTTGTLKSGTLHTVLELLFSTLGAAALLIIVIAGLRFVTSAGDPQKAAHARATVIFALLGLVIAISAEAILNFVVGSL